jgi:hypothetical protein
MKFLDSQVYMVSNYNEICCAYVSFKINHCGSICSSCDGDNHS